MTYNAKITKIGNSKGVRLPKELALSLTEDVTLEQTEDGVLIKSIPLKPLVPPLSEWVFENVTPEPEFKDWDITLMDGLEDDE